jgi:hypothetical protein
MPFELQPILTGKLLRLRPLRAADFDDLYAVASDPLIREQHPARNRYLEDVFRKLFRESLESGGALVAHDAKDGEAALGRRLQQGNEAAHFDPFRGVFALSI